MPCYQKGIHSGTNNGICGEEKRKRTGVSLLSCRNSGDRVPRDGAEAQGWQGMHLSEPLGLPLGGVGAQLLPSSLRGPSGGPIIINLHKTD